MKFVFKGAKMTADELRKVSELLTVIVGEDDVNWELNSSALPQEIAVAVAGARRILAMDWTPMFNAEGRVQKMMLTLRDITEHRALEQKVKESEELQQRKMAVLGKMLAVERVHLTGFIRDTEARVEVLRELAAAAKPDLQRMFQELHTLKGGARAMKFADLAAAVHEAETSVQACMKGAGVSKTFELRGQLEAVFATVKYLGEVYQDVFGGEAAAAEGQWSLYSFASLVYPTVLQTARDEGLALKRFDIVDRVGRWDDAMRANVNMMLGHCVNNAVDHGFVLPKRRGEAARDIEIEVLAERVGGRIRLRVADRGAGLDLAKIAGLARKLGREDLAASRPEEILFETGASTADKLTLTSGRGVGLGAIRNAARELGGDARIAPRDGGGTVFEISLVDEARPEQRKVG
jgi:chemotaxis protein histidine kinase CheA